MKSNSVMAIAIGDDEIVGIKAYKIEGATVVEDVVSYTRNSDIGTDMQEFFEYYGEEGIPIGCVFASELRTRCLETPMMNKLDQYSFAQREGKRIFDEEEHPVAIDFASRPGTTDELMMLLIVALERKKIKDMARSIQRGNGDLHIIDYWPAPLAYSRGRESSMLFVTPEGDQVRVSIWNYKFCVAHTLVNPNLEDVLVACEQVYGEAESFHIPYPKGVILVGFDEQNMETYEPVLEKYGVIEQVPIHVVDKGADYNPNHMTHEMAMGLAIRLLTHET